MVSLLHRATIITRPKYNSLSLSLSRSRATVIKPRLSRKLDFELDTRYGVSQPMAVHRLTALKAGLAAAVADGQRHSV